MIVNLRLTNFRQHREKSFDFSDGLVGIRGRNEQGKSTVFEAFSYLVYGARALGKSVARVVTWGEPENSLRVEGALSVGGIMYTAYRSPKGAEVTFRDAQGEQRITGQTETSAFFAKLLGASRDMAAQLMFVKQKQIAETLEEPGKAVALIEKLSEMHLIDRMVEVIQFELSTGNTKALEASLAEAQEKLEKAVAPVLNDAPLLEIVAAAREVIGKAELRLAAGQEAARLAMDLSVAYSTAVAQATAAKSAVTGKQRDIASLDESLRGLNLVSKYSAEDAEKAEKAKQEARDAVDTLAKYERWSKLPVSQASFSAIGDNAEAELEADLKRCGDTLSRVKAALKVLNEKISTLNNTIWENGALRIRETACGLCGKDLQNVPEVVEKNAAVAEKEAALKLVMDGYQTELTALTKEEKDASAEQSQLLALQSWASKHVMPLLNELERDGFLQLDRKHYPPKSEWTGRSTDVKAYQDASAKLADVMTELQRVASQKQLETHLLGQHGRAVKELEKLIAEELVLADKVAQFVPGAVDDHLEKSAAAAAMQRELDQYRAALAEEEQELAAERARYAQAVLEHQILVGSVADKRAMLTEYNENNDIIKRLREAKPVFADKLWTSVMSAVSKHFSDIRGKLSVVTRTDNEFAIDSVPVIDFSGSTIDSLGLAVRGALTRTFLPNVDFLLLDEPAAACDDEREAAMLGVLSTLGFKQIIVISHSDVLDSFATSIVEL